MRKNRILWWVLCLVLAFITFKSESFFAKMNVEKLPLYVYAPKKMEQAFNTALKSANLKDEYEIIMTNDSSNANITVQMGKEFDDEYTKIAYSPFVIAYSSEDKNIENMIDKGLLQDAFFDAEYKEINFNKVIEEVLKEGKWENLGVEDMGTINVYYPAPDTDYYTDYYDFMLVTVNAGKYPKDENELKKAMEQISNFENSEYTEAINNFDEKIIRTGGFMENSIYLLPEQEAWMISNTSSNYGRLFYPTITVYANYYVKADELGSKLVDVFDDPNTFSGNFYEKIDEVIYRNDWDNKLGTFSRYLYGERDVYNVLHLDSTRIRPENLKESEETPAS